MVDKADKQAAAVESDPAASAEAAQSWDETQIVKMFVVYIPANCEIYVNL